MDEPQALLDNGDIPGLIRHLRANAEQMDLRELARLTEGAAAASGFDDLRETAAVLAGTGGGGRLRRREREPGVQELYDFGYACIERGVAALAVPALRAALAALPGEVALVRELAAALERDDRHAEVVEVLDANAALLEPWPDRYLLAFNTLMSGDAARAEEIARALPEPDETWAGAGERLERMLARARAVRPVTALDALDLRGWHFVIGGTVLLSLSPHGFAAGMAGRFAYLGGGYGQCRRAVERLRLVLDAAEARPERVALLPDRSSTILGLAAAELLGLPAEPFEPGRPGTLAVAHDLNDVEEDVLRGLWERADGQVLFEHATCWTAPPAVTPDVSGLLHQVAVAPWGAGMRARPDGSVERTEPDGRPAEEIAAEIVRAAPDDDAGDGDTPPDPDGAPAALIAAARSCWLAGPRDAVLSPGPVRSSRFA
ncbi:hypothetical protein BJF79_42820 [Actinomadura sp. CNU-125]|uniref:hypothetical protein n=1 Tax=Actinomadura sp. CNU-125 TaxID=1904961 RepID=UPI0009656B4A|nr:hypothetical protein [Actinomadura sp. CNU-125]OLT27104.1 hypothetical protein BJF79_42820 [Actinomadura sp. CNU-125]